MAPNDQTFRLTNDVGSLGLRCTSTGVSLAGIPLLRKTITGWAPRPAAEIDALIERAYGRQIDPASVSPGLEVIAQALNRSDLGRAMVATVRLRLPEVSRERASYLAKAYEAFIKYDPDEPRDSHGRWTTGEDSGDGVSTSPRLRTGAPSTSNISLTPIANQTLASDDPASIICNVATRLCQMSALKDKDRLYFDSCWKSEKACEEAVILSRIYPEQPIGVIYPDHTAVYILDGRAIITHISGTKLVRPFTGR